MSEKKVVIEYTVFDGPEKLDQTGRQLLDLAMEASRKAYSPYSKFRVGAALLLADDSIVTGSNQENAAYPSGICAERVAIFYASSQKPGVAYRRIAIVAPDSPAGSEFPISPCGACRQVLAEYEGMQQDPLEIILWDGKGSIWMFKGIAQLLPFYFSAGSLG
jgi:cytidine deaminase